MIEAQYMLYGAILGVITAYIMERVYREKLLKALTLLVTASENLMEDKLALEAKIRDLEQGSPPS